MSQKGKPTVSFYFAKYLQYLKYYCGLIYHYFYSPHNLDMNDLKKYYIPKGDIKFGRLLGRGTFEVWSGVWLNKGGGIDVAITKVRIYIPYIYILRIYRIPIFCYPNNLLTLIATDPTTGVDTQGNGLGDHSHPTFNQTRSSLHHIGSCKDRRWGMNHFGDGGQESEGGGNHW